MNKKVHIIGGGTNFYIAPHFALSSPAYGNTARTLEQLYKNSPNNKLDVCLHLTKMANPSNKSLDTNEDISSLIDTLISDYSTKIIVLNAALCDYKALNVPGKEGERFSSRNGNITLNLEPAEKIVKKIRKERKDIFAVAFKATSGLSSNEQYISGLNLLKESSVNLVLANDIKTHNNMIITPEEARYNEGTDRATALKELVEMSLARSHLTFTRSTVIAGKPVPWNSPLIPDALRTVVNYCIKNNAYKPFRGATVGHFACKLDENTFLTSIRKSNFNDLDKNGLVKVVTDGPDSVLAYGSKPSVGGNSQRIIFHEHQDYDCILHFHVYRKPGSKVPEVSQKMIECGSDKCGRQTSNGLKRFGNLNAVYLQEHGPNIVFHSSIDPKEVINFIEDNFDLSTKTGGYVS